MDDFGAYVGISLGVLVAVAYPILRGYISKQFVVTAEAGWPPWVKKYGALLAFCLITGLIVLAAYRSQSNAKIGFWQALVMGFGWEAAVEKVVVKPR